MEYNRSFIIQSCHFNDNQTYDNYRKAMRAAKGGQHEVAFATLLDVFKDIHGHNFQIGICASSVELADCDCERGEQAWVVPDELLRDMVAEWDNTNLSVHPDFAHCRATTESMVLVLGRKLSAAVPGVEFTVLVRERDDVAANAVFGATDAI